MKKYLIFVFIICWSSLAYASDLSQTFTEKYNSLTPPENSSVHSDYLFEQMALGSEYTVKLLDQLDERNSRLNEKVDVMIEKFDILIEQNKQIIELLKEKKEASND